MAPGGDCRPAQDLLTSPHVHSCHFKEMLCITKLLPVGNISKPLDKLTLQCYYMLYHKSNRDKFVLSGKTLDDKTIESILAFFRLFLNRKSSAVYLNAKRRNVSADASLAKLRRSSVDGSARPLMAGAAIAPDMNLLFAMIDTATSSTTEIGAIIVVVSTTIVVTMTAAPPTER